MATVLKISALLVAVAGFVIGLRSLSLASDIPAARYVGLGTIIDYLIYALVLYALGHIVDRLDALFGDKAKRAPLPDIEPRSAQRTGDSYLDGSDE